MHPTTEKKEQQKGNDREKVESVVLAITALKAINYELLLKSYIFF